jgi:hypothetical protein
VILEKITFDLIVTCTSEDKLATINTNCFCMETLSWMNLNSWLVGDIFTRSKDVSFWTITTELSGVKEESWVTKAIPELDIKNKLLISWSILKCWFVRLILWVLKSVWNDHCFQRLLPEESYNKLVLWLSVSLNFDRKLMIEVHFS